MSLWKPGLSDVPDETDVCSDTYKLGVAREVGHVLEALGGKVSAFFNIGSPYGEAPDAGRGRRRLSVTQAKKIDVHVTQFGVLGGLG